MPKYTKNTKNDKNTKNHNHITCSPRTECGRTFCQIWASFVPLPHFLAQKSEFSKNEKKTPRDIIILHALRCLINVGV